MRGIVIALALAMSACGFTHGEAARDAGAGDGGAGTRKQMEVTSGAARVTNGTRTIDVQIGHGVLVRQSTNGTRTISGSPVIRP